MPSACQPHYSFWLLSYFDISSLTEIKSSGGFSDVPGMDKRLDTVDLYGIFS